jgi:hypothetical protein
MLALIDPRHDQGVMQSVLGAAPSSPASPPTVLLSARSGLGHTRAPALWYVCHPSPFLLSLDAHFD